MIETTGDSSATLTMDVASTLSVGSGNTQFLAGDQFVFSASGTITVKGTDDFIYFEAHRILGVAESDAVLDATDLVQVFSDTGKDITTTATNDINLTAPSWEVEGSNVIFQATSTVNVDSDDDMSFYARPVGTRSCSLLQDSDILPPVTCDFKTAFQIEGQSVIFEAQNQGVNMKTSILEILAEEELLYKATGASQMQITTKRDFETASKTITFKSATFAASGDTDFWVSADGTLSVVSGDTITQQSTGERVYINGGNVVFDAATTLNVQSNTADLKMNFDGTTTTTSAGATTIDADKGYLRAYVLNGQAPGVLNIVADSNNAFFDVGHLDINTMTDLVLQSPEGDITLISGANFESVSTSENKVQSGQNTNINAKEVIMATGDSVLLQGQTSVTLSSDEDVAFWSTEAANNSLALKNTDADADMFFTSLNGVVELDAGTTLDVTADDQVTMNGGYVYTVSGDGSDITLKAGDDMELTTDDGTNYGDTIVLNGRVIESTADGATNMLGGDILLKGVDVNLNGQTVDVQAAGEVTVSAVLDFSASASGEADINGAGVRFTSGMDKDIYVSSKTDSLFNAQSEIIIYGEGNMTMYSERNFTVTSNFDVRYWGQERLHAHGESSFLSSAEEDTKLISGGAVEIASGKGDRYDVRVESAKNWDALASREFRILSDGDGTDDCGISIRSQGAQTDRYSSQANLNMDGQNIRITSTDTTDDAKGWIAFKAGDSAIYHAEEGGMHFLADTTDISVKTISPWGHMEHDATTASIFYIGSNKVDMSAGEELAFHGRSGVNFITTEDGGDIAFNADLDINIDGVRGLNVSAGTDVPFAKGNLNFDVEGQIQWLSDDEVVISNIGPARTQANPDLPAVKINGQTATFSTGNSYDISMAAFTDFNVNSGTGTYTVLAQSGNIDVTAQTGSLVVNAPNTDSDIAVSSSKGPIIVNAGGTIGRVDLKADSWDIDADILLLYSFEGRSQFAATQGQTLTSDGSLHLQTLGRTGDISLGAGTTLTITTTGNREIPEDRIVFAGSHLEYEAGANLITTATKTMSIGGHSEPVISINSGGDAATTGFSLTTTGDMKIGTDADLTIQAPGGLTALADQRLELRSLGDFLMSTISTEDEDLAITAGAAGSVGDITVEGALVQHQTNTEFSIALGDATSKLTMQTTGEDFDEDIMTVATGGDIIIETETDFSYTASDAILAELDVSASFFTFETLRIRNPTFTGIDEDTDQGSIQFISATDILVTQQKVVIQTTDVAEAPITFLSKNEGAVSLMRIETEAADSPITITATKGRVAFEGKNQAFSSAAGALAVDANVVDADGKGGTIDVIAAGAATWASDSEAITATSAGDIFFQTTAFSGDVTFDSQTNPFIMTTGTDMSFRNGLEDGGTIDLDSDEQVILANGAGTTADVNIDADGGFSATMRGDASHFRFSGLIDLASGDEFLISNQAASMADSVKFQSTNADDGDLLFHTSGQDSSISVSAGNIIGISTGAAGGDQDNIILQGSNGVSLGGKNVVVTASAGNLGYASSQGNVVFTSVAQDVNVGFASATFKSFGENSAENFGFGIDAQSIDIDASTGGFSLTAEEGVEFVMENSAVAGKSIAVKSLGGAIPAFFDASGYNSGIRMVSDKDITSTSVGLSMQAGNVLRATAVKQTLNPLTTQPVVLKSDFGRIVLETTEEAESSDVLLDSPLFQNNDAASKGVLAQGEDIVLQLSTDNPLNFQTTATVTSDPFNPLQLRARTEDINIDATTITHDTDNLYFNAGRVISAVGSTVEIQTQRFEMNSGRDIMMRAAQQGQYKAADAGTVTVRTSQPSQSSDINILSALGYAISAETTLSLNAKGDDGDIIFRNDEAPLAAIAAPLSQEPNILFDSVAATQDLIVNAENAIQWVANEQIETDGYDPSGAVPASQAVHTAFLQAAGQITINTHENFKDIYMVAETSTKLVAADIAVTEWASTLGFFEQTPKPVQWVGTQSLEVCAYQPRLNDNPIAGLGIFCGLQGASTEAEGYNEHGTDNDLRNPSRSVTYHAALQVLSDRTRRIQLALADIGLINYPQQNPDDGLGVICLFPQA